MRLQPFGETSLSNILTMLWSQIFMLKTYLSLQRPRKGRLISLKKIYSLLRSMIFNNFCKKIAKKDKEVTRT